MATFKEDFERLYHRLTSARLRTPSTPAAMNGTIIHCDSHEDVYNAGIFYLCMGVPVIFTEEYIAGSLQSNKVYAGVLQGRFGMYSPSEVIELEPSYHMYSLSQGSDYRSNLYTEARELRSIICETPESAIYIGMLADDLGFRWASGRRYIDTDMFFNQDDLYGGKCYNLGTGLYGERDSFGNTYTQTLQQVLFNTTTSLLGIPAGLNYDDLRNGSIYVVYREVINSYSAQKVRIPFKKERGSIGDTVFYLSGQGCINSRSNLLDTVGAVIMEATEEEKRLFRDAYRNYQIHLAGERAQIRQNNMLSRERRLREAGLNKLKQVYPITRDRLFSDSMHKILLRVWDTNKIARTLLKLNTLGYSKGVLRNITINKSTQEMTYTLPNKDTVMTPNDRWETKGRQSGKYGKILRKVLTEQVPRFKINDSELEQLVNHLKACADNGEFRIVSGEDIQYWYDGYRYAQDEDTGTLACSCMRHNTEYMELYAKNPDVCQMVILVKDGALHGRALLWQGKWMDRIYGSDSTITAFKNYARSRGYHAKSAQNSDNWDMWTNPETGDEYQEAFTISLDTDCEYYPYADTFFFIDLENGLIANEEIGDGVQLRSTDGELHNDERVYDEYNERYIHQEDSVYMEYVGYYTHTDSAYYCDITNEYYLHDDMVELYNGEMVYKEAEDIVYCDQDDMYAHIDDTFTCEYEDEIYVSMNNVSEYIDELGITVHENNVASAYSDAGYEYNDETEEWEEIKTKQEA